MSRVGKWTVLQVLQQRLRGGLYLVSDDRGRERIMRELIPSNRMAEREVEARHSLAANMLTLLEQVRHPHVARVLEHFRVGRNLYIVEELVEGVSLREQLHLDPSASHPDQVLVWARQIAAAVECLHDRPRPYLLGESLELDHVMVDRRGNLKLVNLGVRRLFQGYASEILAHSPREVKPDRLAFSHLIRLMLTHRELFPRVTPPLKRVFRAGQRATFKQIRTELERPWKKSRRRRVFRPRLRLWQPIAVALLVLLCWWAPWRPQGARPAEECVYVACGSELVGVTVATHQVFARLDAPVPLNAVGVQGQTVWAASAASDLLWGVGGPQHRPVRQAVGRGPSTMVQLEGGDLLTAMPARGRVAVTDERGTIDLTVGRGASFATSDHDRIYVSCPESDQVAVLRRRPLQVSEPFVVDDPGPIAVAGGRLVVASPAGLGFYGRSLEQQVECLPCVGLVARPNSDHVWAWHSGGRVSVWDARRGTLIGQLQMPADVAQGTFVAGGGEFWATLPSTGQIAVVSASSRTLRGMIDVGASPGALARVDF
jgi:hypothetical protein